MKNIKRLSALLTALAMIIGLCSFTVFADTEDGSADETVIVLSDDGITVNGSAVTEDETDAVYIANDIIYYEDLDYYEDTGYEYGEGTDEDKHSEEEAAAHTVVHITEAGTYRVSGTLSLGQLFIDLGDDAKTDETAVVTLILDNVTITCTVAPAVLFYSVYECDTAWVAYDEGDTEDYTASAVQDTSAAGANVIIADGSENNIYGSYVAKIYKNNGNSKKLYKFDGAFYSKMSMNIDGEAEESGVLNIYAEYEGLDSELHLTINSGIINIQSKDDGINTNEDNVSVTTINGGSVHILAGLGDEGDGIDSNGYLMINGGVVISIANPSADSGLDSDCGSYINGGTVLATGSTMDWSDEDTANGLGTQPTMNLQFEEAQDSDEAIIVTDSEGNVIFAYDPDQDETTGSYNRGYQGAIISCSELEVGATYYVYIGGTVSGTDTNGLYDNSTVTGFTGAVRQIYTGTDVGMDNMPGTGNDSGMGDMGDFGDSEGTFPGGDSNNGDSGMGDMGDMGDFGDMGGDSSGGSSQIQPRTVSESASYALAEGTTYSNQFYLTDYVNAFSGVQDDPDYESDDTDDGTTDDDTDDGTTDDDTDDGTTDDDSADPDIDGDMAVPPDGGDTDGDTDDNNTGDDTDDGSADDDTDDGTSDDDTSDDGTSDGTASGNWEGYLEYLIAYAEENYDTIAAPDYSSTVEELTAAIAELTEDTYSSSILYAVVTELGGALTYEEWLAEYGTTDDGSTDDSSADDGTDDGSDDDADDGSDDDSAASPETPNDESSDDESTDDNISDDSLDNDAGSDDSSDDAGSTDTDAGDDTTDTDDSGSSDEDDALTDEETDNSSAGSESEDSDSAQDSAGTDETETEESEETADEESTGDAEETSGEDTSDEDTSDEDTSDEDTSDEESESESAQTGDHTNMIFWFVLAAVSAAALCFLGFRRKFN